MRYKEPVAEELVSRLVKLAPRDPNCHYLYGQWAQLNNYGELAIAEWNKSLSLAVPTDEAKMVTYSLIGIVESQLNQLEEADRAFQMALQANLRRPKQDPGSALSYVDFLEKTGRDIECQKVVDLILSWDPGYGPAHLARALYLNKQSEWVKSYEQATLALKDDRNGVERERALHLLLVRLCAILQRLSEVQDHQNWLKADSEKRIPQNATH